MRADKNINTLAGNQLIDGAVETLKVLADPTRIRILLLLHANHALSVGEIARLLSKKQAGISQHLARLRMLRLVKARQEGTTVWYSLADEHTMKVIIEALNQAEHSLSYSPLDDNHKHGIIFSQKEF